MADPDLESFQQQPSGKAPGPADPADPVSWLQIEQGWNVVSSDDSVVGTVAQVAGDKQADIFDGLAVATAAGGDQSGPVVYVPGEQVALIYTGKVTLKITAEQAAGLGPYGEAPPQTTLRPGPVPLGSRISNFFRKR